MARILHNGDWYEQVSTEALYEEEYERILLSLSDQLFPTYWLVPFKRTVSSESNSAKADFALVHRSYRDWWVVEAELAHHSFGGHVRPQIETLSQAFYGEESADYLASKDSRLDVARMRSVVKGQQPRVLVIVNGVVPTWGPALSRYGALVMVLEMFRSLDNKHVFRMNGERPPDVGSISSECVLDVARCLRVLSPGILPIQSGEAMSIVFRGGLTEWVRTDLQDRIYLSCSKPLSLESKVRYQLIQREDSSFSLHEPP
jgi:hypothetical protein